MIEERDEERLQQEVDGENGQEEAARLRQELAARPEARHRLDELVRLSDQLAEIGQIDPPPGLRQAVLRSIAERRRVRSAAGSGPSFWSWFGVALAGRARPSHAYAFVAGAVLGIAILTLAGGRPLPLSPLEESTLRGTMLPEARSGVAEADGRLELSLAGYNGEAKVQRSGEQAHVELELRGEGRLRISGRLDGGVLLGFERSRPAADLVRLEGSSFLLETQGSCRYRLRVGLEGARPARLRLKLEAAGEELVRNLDLREEVR